MKKLMYVLLVTISLVSCNKEVEESNSKQVYRAEFSQVGEDDPVINIFENNIGLIEWTYISDGVYQGYLDGAFKDNRTFVLCNNGVNGYISGDIRVFSEDFVEFRTFSGLDNFGTPKLSNGISGLSFEISVYN